MTLLRDKEPEVSEPTFHAWVFSLPRCGSSMMTGAVEALGFEMVYTTEDPEAVAKRNADMAEKFGDYVPNEKFYEIGPYNQFTSLVKATSTPRGGCKMIIPIPRRDMRFSAVISVPSKVIMMARDPAEIRQSQEAFYKKARANYGDPLASQLPPARVAEQHIAQMLARQEAILQEQRKASNDARFTPGLVTQPFDYMKVQYRDILEEPQRWMEKIGAFLCVTDEARIKAAVATIDPDKCRFKSEQLEEGI